MATETTAKKDVQKLQRAIVDGLEDIKAQDIRVFDTTQLTPLFERVIVASGTSNRQTKALAASVRDKVKQAGFKKPRTEGQDNGEWIIVDCGQAVVHVMQPAIRQYYNLEEIWGEKPVRMKFGAPAPKKAVPSTATGKAAKKSMKSTETREEPLGSAIKNKATGGTKAAKSAVPKATRLAATQPAAQPVAKKVAKAPVKKLVVGASAKKTTAGRTQKTATGRKTSAARRV